jgi:hypothetical protein
VTDYWDRIVPVSRMLGLTMTSVSSESDTVRFVSDCGIEFCLQHHQNCCESVYLADVAGDLTDLVGSPLLVAEEMTSHLRPGDVPPPEYEPESQTWTFYRFATIAGSVTLRWCGESNGYYSESVECTTDQVLCSSHDDCRANVALALACARERGLS